MSLSFGPTLEPDLPKWWVWWCQDGSHLCSNGCLVHVFWASIQVPWHDWIIWDYGSPWFKCQTSMINAHYYTLSVQVHVLVPVLAISQWCGKKNQRQVATEEIDALSDREEASLSATAMFSKGNNARFYSKVQFIWKSGKGKSTEEHQTIDSMHFVLYHFSKASHGQRSLLR